MNPMNLMLYNTETREKQKITPLHGNTIRLYTCGPTVYSYSHIGNLRAYVAHDLLRRTLEFFGTPVLQVMNITDVDDKTILGAIEKGCSLEAFTQPYTEAFFADLVALHILPAHHYPKATDYVPEMIALIENLLREGVAYRGGDGSIYFAIARFPSYGRLSHLKLDELKPGVSGEIPLSDEYGKERASDFALWKAYDPVRDGEIFWESPLGKGRPGWHIECSAMAMKLLGPEIDIHAGGVDNIFPHHENEIAQSESFSHCRFVSHWFHVEHLLVEHRKMSKSLGNLYTLRDLRTKGYSADALRLLLLQTHYRTQLNFTYLGLDAAKNSLERLFAFILRLRSIAAVQSGGSVEPLLKRADSAFRQALLDDLNISVALAALFDLVRDVNALCDAQRVGSAEADKILSWLTSINQVLAVLPLEPVTEAIPPDLKEALIQRERARSEKNWAEADRWRKTILDRGYLIDDTPEGPRLKKQ